MQFPFISNNPKKIFAVFDVGSDSVGASIVQYISPNDPPKILKTFREDIIFRENLDFMIFMDDMIKTLKLVAFDVSLAGVGTISDIHIVLSSPWYVSENRHVFVSEPKPFIFNDKLSNDIFNKEIAKLKKDHHDKYGGNLDALNIVEKEIVQVSLNGYPVDNPIGKKATQVDMNILITLSSGVAMDTIKNSLESVFHSIPLYFHSNISSLYIVIREKYHNMNAYTIVDIGGEVTDVCIVDNGIPKNIISFPYGRQNVYRDLMKILKKNKAEISSLLSLYIDDTLESKEKSKITTALQTVEKSWVDEFENAFRSIPEPKMLPNSVFLVVNKDIHQIFLDLFNQKNSFIYKVFKNNCNIVGLQGPDFLGLCKIGDGVCDSMLMIQALSVRRKYIK